MILRGNTALSQMHVSASQDMCLYNWFACRRRAPCHWACFPSLLLSAAALHDERPPTATDANTLHAQVFCTVWEASPKDRPTLQRVLSTWDRIFPLPALDAIRRRTGLAPALASAPQQPATAQRPAAAVQQPSAAAQLQPPQQQQQQAKQPAPIPMQRDPATLGQWPEQPQQQPQIQQQYQQQPALLQFEQQATCTPLLQQQQQQQQPPQQQQQGKLGPDQYAELRAAAAARLAALRAPAPQGQFPASSAAAGTGVACGGFGGRTQPSGAREYEPTMPGQGGAAPMAPEQLSQLEVLLRSLAQGGGIKLPPASASTPAPSLDELWSSARLRVRMLCMSMSAAVVHLHDEGPSTYMCAL